ncbi:MAG: cyclase family protein [Bryobacterales bacterium]|nr:cyclase family protein [Bryobacteraceae bacterium]MDW8130464.1 cyclase family protein [Bryobacterales bacterium]
MRLWIGLLACAAAVAAQAPKGWVKGKGYGWIWGPQDEVGALNAIRGPDWVRRALAEVKLGRVYDLGVRVDRRSYKWPGHSPIEVMTFRSPQGVKTGKDIPGFAAHPRGLAFHSCALFISDNVGTQIDSLGHITRGRDDHWYNGFRELDYGGDFGLRKADADSIPPIIARAVLVDVAGWKGVDALPSRFAIGPRELEGALARQQVAIEPGDAVLIRTGTLRFWGESGADHDRIAQHDSAGLTLEGARWLVEQKGAVLIASDTSGLEWGGDSGLPVHEYLLIEQGVHIGEFFYLEELARDKAWRFALIVTTNRIRGTTAGFALRPLALR